MSDVSVGRILAQAREDKGMSIDDVSASTRIRATLIRGIEADDFEHCGGDFYARGHIRSIAHVLGVDPAPLIADYDRAHGGAPVPSAPTQPVPADLSDRTVRRRPNWAAAMVVALLAVCGIAGAELALSHSGNSPDQVNAVVTPPADSTPSATAPATSSSSPASSDTKPAGTTTGDTGGAVAAVPRDKVTVLVRVTTGQTWVSAKNGAGQILFQGLMSAGELRQFVDAKSLQLVIGNAPAVQLVVNNHDIGTPPAQGNVARLTFTPGDFANASG